jgi:hypothetical protein
MKNLVVNIMSVALEVIMWITLIACIIAGVVIAKDSRSSLIAGFVIGTIAGMLINILVWGSIALMVEIRNYVKETAESNGTIRDYIQRITKKDETAVSETKNEAPDAKKTNLNIENFLR